MTYDVPKLNFPGKLPQIKKVGYQLKLWDPTRKKWLNYTPEEWVRQSTVLYMRDYLNYPFHWMQVEKEISLYNTTKRIDVLIHNASLKPWILIECKAPSVAMQEKVIDQAVKYNLSIHAPYLFITNGMEHRALSKFTDSYRFIDRLPNREESRTNTNELDT
jgi:hypothetical protein